MCERILLILLSFWLYDHLFSFSEIINNSQICYFAIRSFSQTLFKGSREIKTSCDQQMLKQVFRYVKQVAFINMRSEATQCVEWENSERMPHLCTLMHPVLLKIILRPVWSNYYIRIWGTNPCQIVNILG